MCLKENTRLENSLHACANKLHTHFWLLSCLLICLFTWINQVLNQRLNVESMATGQLSESEIMHGYCTADVKETVSKDS